MTTTLKGTIFVTAGIFLGTFFSYLLQIGLGRLLSVEDFGTFTTLLSLSVILAIPATAISTALIKKVSELLVFKDFYTLTIFFGNFITSSLAAGGLLAFAFIILNRYVSVYLNITSGQTIVTFASFLAVSFLNVGPQAYLQGLLRFKAFAFFNALSQFLRLIIPLGLVYLGLTVSAVYFGMALALLVSYGVALTLLHKNFKMGIKLTAQTVYPNLNRIYKELIVFSIPVLLVSSGLALLNNIDVIMVKHFFSPFDAGIYAGVVTMGKVFLFGAGMVQVVMFPQVSHIFASNGNYKARFLKFLTLQLTLLTIGIAVFTFVPQLINRIMFGGKFASSVGYLPLFSIFVGLYVLLTFLTMFLLAISKTKAYVFILPVCVAQCLLINIYHGDIFNVIHANIAVTGTACLLIIMYVIQSLREGVRNSPHL